MAVSAPRRRLFTVDEYYEMARVGILKPGERVQLLDGEVVAMNPIGSPHAWCLKRVVRIFSPHADRCILSIQDPLRIDAKSEPEPDIALLQPDTADDQHPVPADVFLLIEIADSSIRVDRGRKRQMYARAGIPEYWIVDLNARRIEVYRDPAGRRYRDVRLAGPGDTISPLFAPDLAVDVDAVLGREASGPA